MRKYEVSINNKLYSALVKKYTATEAELEINGQPYLVKFDKPISANYSVMPASSPVQAQPVQVPSAAPPATVAPTSVPKANSPSDVAETITAPIPGSILEVLVKEGDTVDAGQTVFKMEAMKMENDINTTGAGTVKSIKVKVGEAVNQGQELMLIG